MYNHSPDTFLFGSIDLFMTARLSDKVSTLGEVLFIAQNNNSIELDVERLMLRYRQSDYLTAAIGRYHSWVGYYNSAFNYGEFLETTTDRPFIYAFDDQGGVLPMQEVGITLTGKIPSGKMGLNYVVEVGNGEAWGPERGARAEQPGCQERQVHQRRPVHASRGDLRLCSWDFRSAMPTFQFRVRRSAKPSLRFMPSSSTAITRFLTRACW